MQLTGRMAKVLRREAKQWPEKLVMIPRAEWPVAALALNLVEVWRSRRYLVQVYRQGDHERLSVCMTAIKGGRWEDGLTWDDLQDIKRECGRGDRWAVECYPPDADIVNVANMRHLFLLDARPPFGWANR